MKHHIVPVKLYLVIITALLVLTIVTVEVAKRDFGAMNNVIALGIALVKMMLVVTIFMHLKYSPKILWLYAGAALVWLVIMLTFTIGDYVTRPWDGHPPGWERSVSEPPRLPAPAHAATSHDAGEPAAAAHH
jgi:cytochrome c oxidase subunit 4